MEARVPISALVPRSLRDSLQREADRNQNSVAAEVRRAIAEHVDEVSQRARPIPAGGPNPATVDAGGAARNGEPS
jgi:hypothetical protein